MKSQEFEVQVVCTGGVARTFPVEASSAEEAIEKVRAVLPHLCRLSFQCTPLEGERQAEAD